MENASASFLEAVRRSMRPIRMVLGSTTVDPALLTHAKRLQHEGYLWREETYSLIRATCSVCIRKQKGPKSLSSPSFM